MFKNQIWIIPWCNNQGLFAFVEADDYGSFVFNYHIDEAITAEEIGQLLGGN